MRSAAPPIGTLQSPSERKTAQEVAAIGAPGDPLRDVEPAWEAIIELPWSTARPMISVKILKPEPAALRS